MAHAPVATRVLREAHLDAAINVDSGRDSWTWFQEFTAKKLMELRHVKEYTIKDGVEK